MSNDLARSIKRTLEVLEYFDEEHRAASVGEISRELGYPQSSTSILLKSLMSLGYLFHDESNRTYRPTARVAMLGRGIRPYLFGDGSVVSAMNELSQKTGELIILAARSGLSVHYLHVIPATNPLRMHLRAGAIRPLVGSAVGHLFLSGLAEGDVEKVISRALAQKSSGPGPDPDVVRKEVCRIRDAGYVLSMSTVTPGGGVLGMLLPYELDQQSLAICIGGVQSVLLENADRFINDMRDVIGRHVGGSKATKP